MCTKKIKNVYNLDVHKRALLAHTYTDVMLYITQHQHSLATIIASDYMYKQMRDLQGHSPATENLSARNTCYNDQQVCPVSIVARTKAHRKG